MAIFLVLISPYWESASSVCICKTYQAYHRQKTVQPGLLCYLKKFEHNQILGVNARCSCHSPKFKKKRYIYSESENIPLLAGINLSLNSLVFDNLLFQAEKFQRSAAKAVLVADII